MESAVFQQIMLYAVLAFLFVSTSFAKTHDKRPAHLSVVAITNWISTTFALHHADDRPLPNRALSPQETQLTADEQAPLQGECME